MPGSPPRRFSLVVVALGAVVAATLLVSPSRTVGALESLSADPTAFGLALVCLYLVRPVLAWPTTPLSAVVGYGFGVALGVPIALGGIVLTVTPVFVAARWVAGGAGSWSRVPFGRAFARTNRAVRGYFEVAGPTRGVVAARLAPIPSDVTTCAAAASGVRLGPFLLGTAVGELPWTIAAVVVGASAATVASDGLGDLGLTLALACSGAAVLVLARPAYRLVRSRSRPSTSPNA